MIHHSERLYGVFVLGNVENCRSLILCSAMRAVVTPQTGGDKAKHIAMGGGGGARSENRGLTF